MMGPALRRRIWGALVAFDSRTVLATATLNRLSVEERLYIRQPANRLRRALLVEEASLQVLSIRRAQTLVEHVDFLRVGCGCD